MTNNTLPLFTPSESVPIAAQLQITTTQVTDENRVSFWPQHFGNIPQWIILEPTVFAGWTASAPTTAEVSGILYAQQRRRVYGS